MLAKDIQSKLEQLCKRMTTMGRDTEENLELSSEGYNLQNRNNQLGKVLRNCKIRRLRMK